MQIALDLGVPVSGIAEAVFARSLSGHADQRAAARGLPGPTAGSLTGGTANGVDAEGTVDRAGFVDDVRKALYASKVVAYAQGFDEITAGAAEYGWDIDRARWRRSGAAAASSGPGS